MTNNDLSLDHATVITEGREYLMVAVSSPSRERNTLTLCLAREIDGRLHRVGGRSITLRWDPKTDDLTDNWIGSAYDVLKSELEE